MTQRCRTRAPVTSSGRHYSEKCIELMSSKLTHLCNCPFSFCDAEVQNKGTDDIVRQALEREVNELMSQKRLTRHKLKPKGFK